VHIACHQVVGSQLSSNLRIIQFQIEDECY
jgi:hypothetical protein